jgi:N-formylglutamate amidohydrolase
MERSFERWGEAAPASPVVVSVPHAGRDYPAELIAAARVPLAALRMLEDRHVDAVAEAALGAETMLVQRRARAWIDLNRSERERDPRVDAGASAVDTALTAKVRGGLGLVPRRVAGAGDLWHHRFTGAAIERRIAADHRPYHAELAMLLDAARRRFGVAVLLDLHSMPSLGAVGPRIVVGDRFGRSADGRFVARVEEVAVRAGIPVALNVPYAGGHVVERHGRPAAGVHAIQLELDRSLYLDAALDGLGEGLAATAALVRRAIDALAEEALGGTLAMAAE